MDPPRNTAGTSPWGRWQRFAAAIIGRNCRLLENDGPAYSALMQPLVDNWWGLAREFLQPMIHLPRDPLAFIRFGLRAIQPAQWLARRFSGDPARALFAGLAGHSFLPLSAPASAAFGLVLGAAGHAVGWPFPRGGAQKIADALASYLQSLGGQIEIARPVAQTFRPACFARAASRPDAPSSAQLSWKHAAAYDIATRWSVSLTVREFLRLIMP